MDWLYIQLFSKIFQFFSKVFQSFSKIFQLFSKVFQSFSKIFHFQCFIKFFQKYSIFSKILHFPMFYKEGWIVFPGLILHNDVYYIHSLAKSSSLEWIRLLDTTWPPDVTSLPFLKFEGLLSSLNTNCISKNGGRRQISLLFWDIPPSHKLIFWRACCVIEYILICYKDRL